MVRVRLAELIEQAARLLVAAERPLLHPGGGVLRSGAWDEVRELAEYLSATVTTSQGACGVLPEDHPLCLSPGGYGALGAQAAADVVLLIGGRLGDVDFWGQPPFWGEPDQQKLIQIDIDPQNIALNRPVDLALVGDARAALRALIDAVKRLTPPIPERPNMAEYRATQEGWLAQFEEEAAPDKKPIHPLRLMRDVRVFFPRDAIGVVDGGNTNVWAHYLNRTYAPRSFLWAADSPEGWKQRLALASCMLHNPKLLLLDEPTAEVDPKARRDFWNEINELAAQGITVLVSTHYMDEAEHCHRLAYLAYGNLLVSGTAQEVIDSQALAGFEVTGPDLSRFATLLHGLPGVEHITAFGNTLHVTGHDIEALRATAALKQRESTHRWVPIRAGLEDVFISLMETTEEDNT